MSLFRSKKKARGLSQSEIDSALNKIRKEYEGYVVHYMKPLRVCEAFEERYTECLRLNMPLESFISAEIAAIRELKQKEELKRQQIWNRGGKPQPEAPSFIDKVSKDFEDRLSGYSEIFLHGDANPEIAKLAGALVVFDNDFYYFVNSLLREYSNNAIYTTGQSLEGRLIEFARPGRDEYPSRFTRYVILLGQFPRDYRVIEQEEKRILKDVAVLVNELILELEPLLKFELKKEMIRRIQDALDYLMKIVYDFRLKDLAAFDGFVIR